MTTIKNDLTPFEKQLSREIKGVKNKKQWAVFAPDGYLQYRTIANTKKIAQELAIVRGVSTWEDYSAAGFTTNKILVDIKL